MKISLDKQIYIYSVDTDAFYNEEEMKLHRRLNKNYLFRNELKKKLKKQTESNKINQILKNTNKRIKKTKEKLYKEFLKINTIRNMQEDYICEKNIISVFDSTLTRTLGIFPETISMDFIVVQTYFFDILKDLILNGFMYKGEKYICFTASAGQIRTKKTVFIKESKWEEHRESLMCGLSIDKINAMGGVNINKYLAYLALCNSATDEWKEFDIDKVVVVEDMETTVRSIVDFIDEKTYEITRKEMDLLINHTDGCGMILPRKSKKSFMVRMPWIKGLLVPFPFDRFIKEFGAKGTLVTDIYGKKYDLIKDKIEIILTKSQFKMWKYYSSWDEYKINFKIHNCQAAVCNVEEEIIETAKINYQMLQTLSDMSKTELEKICSRTKQNIINIGRDRETMLKVLGVTEANKNKNYLQQALELYPELLSDTYSKEVLKQVKKSLVKDARAGKLEIDGKYTFICPDLYAFCEFLFLGNKNPNGLLRDGEVYCNLYEKEPKLDCLRSPHLYREHAIRKNVVDKKKARWFITKGLYTSCHDPISKLLMFDCDGDKSLVCADKDIINIAERNMKDIVPLQYEMAKAGAELINNNTIFAGLQAAYTGGNIGVISNDITKIWNSKHINLDVVKWLCMENNFTIDYAKTLYKPIRPIEKGNKIKNYTRSKLPRFFIYAKNKNENGVDNVNSSVVNMLEKLIPNTKINFSAAKIRKFDYKMLMSGKQIKIDSSLIDKYTELDLKKRFMEFQSHQDNYTGDNLYIYKRIRDQLLQFKQDPCVVSDILVEYLYNTKKSSYKTTLWSCFGDIMVENLRRNLGKYKFCNVCGNEFIETRQRQDKCNNCQIEKKKERERNKKRNYRNKLSTMSL